MNKSIMTTFGKCEKFLNDELELFIELLIPILFSLRKAENVYSSKSIYKYSRKSYNEGLN